MVSLFSLEQSRWDRVASFFLLLFAAALPHSIGLAQAAGALMAGIWLVGKISTRQHPRRTPLDLPILLFLGVTVLAAIFSLEPGISLTKLDSAGLILIVPVAADLVDRRRFAIAVVAVLLGSGGISAAPMVWQKIVGEGVDVVAVEKGSPLARMVFPRDVILSCDGQKIKSPEHFNQVLARHERSRALQCQGMRGGVIPFEFRIGPNQLPEKPLPEAWNYTVKRGRGIRARGTYSHFVTYAEVMLQLAALACGFLLAYPRKWSWRGMALLVVALLLASALTATFTRASSAALVVALVAMAWMKLNWRLRLAAVPVGAGALWVVNALLVRWRGVGFYNSSDLSMQYRLTMWEDGWRLMWEHPWLGVGMDTILVRWPELGLRAYERFGLHSHFHSTPIHIAVERGLLGLAAWLLLMGAYAWLLFRVVERTKHAAEWWAHGLALGILGATVGFLASSLVHYNFGDSEVVMVFWLLAGVAVALDRLTRTEAQPG